MGSRKVNVEINQIRLNMFRTNAMLADAWERLNEIEEKLNKESIFHEKHPESNQHKMLRFPCIYQSSHTALLNSHTAFHARQANEATTMTHEEISMRKHRPKGRENTNAAKKENNSNKMRCLLCRVIKTGHEFKNKENHVIWERSQFKTLSEQARKRVIFSQKICINCGLHTYNKDKPCRKESKCNVSDCALKHNPMFHERVNKNYS